MRFDFTDLNLFRHIVEAGSITHGAERSNLALAAASTRIRKMELAFGTPLLVRGRAGVKPTPAGRTLLQHARGILAQTERLQEDLSPYARGLAGQVRVLSNTNALTEFLPETLSSFLMAHPDISVDLEERAPTSRSSRNSRSANGRSHGHQPCRCGPHGFAAGPGPGPHRCGTPHNLPASHVAC